MRLVIQADGFVYGSSIEDRRTVAWADVVRASRTAKGVSVVVMKSKFDISTVDLVCANAFFVLAFLNDALPDPDKPKKEKLHKYEKYLSKSAKTLPKSSSGTDFDVVGLSSSPSSSSTTAQQDGTVSLLPESSEVAVETEDDKSDTRLVKSPKRSRRKSRPDEVDAEK